MSDGELWVDHLCLFHHETEPSASWQEDTGVYFCRVESKAFVVPLVMDALNLRESTSEPGGGVRRKADTSASPGSIPGRQASPPRPPRNKAIAIAYRYTFPDGRPSHVKYRVGDGPNKTIWQERPDGTPGLPEQVYPIYGDGVQGGVQTGHGHLIVVEGEKCVDIIAEVDELYDGSLIRALTCGSSADLIKHGGLLAARIRDLHPISVTLWPDFDQPGFKAMEEVAQQLQRLGVDYRLVAPDDLGLPNKGDAADYLLAGGKLSEVIRKGSVPKTNGSADGMLSRLVVTRDGHVVFPGTRNLIQISTPNATAIWYQEAHGMPKESQAKELQARLSVKSHIMPVDVRPRQHNAPLETWWRPRSTGPAVHISANGVALSDDPEGFFLFTPSDELAYPVDVDLDGSRADLEELGSSFHLSETELAMCEGWLCCALAGLQTPILFMRAPAGTGKTTLARLLLAVVEPLCPELDLSKRQNPDPRELVHTLRSTQALLIDNVSRLDSTIEDQLAKMVTGYTTVLRPLYSDHVVTVRLRRGIILTTTSYDVYKGDLAQRMIVAQPATEQAFKWLPDSVAQERFGRFIPRIRGYIFSRLAEFYRMRPALDVNAIRFRIGDLGLVLAALGYDTNALAVREAASKSEIIAQDDVWLEALVALWKDEDAELFVKTAAELLQWLRDYGIRELPGEQSPRLARYLSEKNPIFADHGFVTEKVQTGPASRRVRGYRFVRSGGHQNVIPELDLASDEDQE